MTDDWNLAKGFAIDITQEDLDAARLTGATGTELVARSIHSRLDRMGVPREGREVNVTYETIEVVVPRSDEGTRA